ncbi:MAG: hypothetical protein K940chlam7_00707 [Chlamydiae bacterium]|nr:hypothetical protein [Chlamydiota bacterium]
MQPHGYVEEADCSAYSKSFGLSRAIGFLLAAVQTASAYSNSNMNMTRKHAYCKAINLRL